jgi:hypothetical protein
MPETIRQSIHSSLPHFKGPYILWCIYAYSVQNVYKKQRPRETKQELFLLVEQREAFSFFMVIKMLLTAGSELEREAAGLYKVYYNMCNLIIEVTYY